MSSTYSDLKIELIGTGDQSGTWGTTTNTNLGTAIEEAITGSADVTFASADITLTLLNTNASQIARNLRLNLTGTSGGARNLVVPSIQKLYLVYNGCADAVTIKNVTGTGVAVPAGKSIFVFNDGVNVTSAVTFVSATTLAIADGGTGATTAANARTNLNVPTRSGGDASGTWAIDISGNATTATSANNITNGGGWSVTPSGIYLTFNYNGTNVAQLDSSGNLTVIGNVTAYGTI